METRYDRAAQFLLFVLIFFWGLTNSLAQVTFERHDIASSFSLYIVRVWDFDKDGDPDILGGYGDLAWFENDGHGNFSKHYVTYASVLWSVYPGDLDNDGDNDMVIAETNSISWCENQGGSFTKHLIQDNYYFAESVAAADLDGDGDMDIASLRWGVDNDPLYNWAGLGIVTWWENTGYNQFRRHDLDVSFANGHKVGVSDLDRDGDVDILACGGDYRSGLSWFENDGSGHFNKHIITASGGLAFSVFDIDKNGTNDIVFCQHSSGAVRLFLNSGGASFSDQTIASNLEWPGYAAPGDFNQDGKTDILIVNQRSETGQDLVWLRNEGNNNFSVQQTNQTTTKPFSGDVADFDNDGIPDITSGSRDDYEIFWLRTLTGQATRTLTVISPNGKEQFAPGETRTIQWNSSGNFNQVKIQYSTDKGSSWKEIVSATANDGSYDWLVPQENSDQSLVRISEAGSGNPNDVSDNVFSITTPQSITVKRPNGGEQFTVGETRTIQWNSSGNFDQVKIQYSVDNGSNWEEIVSATANNGSYDWLVPLENSDRCLIRISESSSGNPTDVSNNAFSIIKPQPIIVQSPNGGEHLATGSTQVITWSTIESILAVKLEYSLDNETSWVTITGSTANNGSYDWLLPNDESINCLVRITDVANAAQSDVSDGVFSIIDQISMGYALSFDGMDDYVEIADNPVLSGGADKSITVEAWVKLKTVSGISPIVSKFLDSEWKDWGIQLNKNVLQVGIESDGDNWECSGGQLQANMWTHVAFIFDNNNNMVRLYINGVEVASKVLSKNMPDTNAPLRIARNYYSDYCFDGEMDEVRIWNYARTVEQLKEDMFHRLLGSEQGLIGYWSFDSGSGQIAVDMTGNGNAGRLGSGGGEDSSDPIWLISTVPLSPVRSLKVLTPNGGERWYAETEQQITWIAMGEINAIKLEYSSDSGINWSLITDSAVNNGTYFWSVPKFESNTCLIRISDAHDSHLAEVSDSIFTVSYMVVPVELISFMANSVDNDTIDLKWSTASEKNNYGFQIERKFKDYQFEPIKFIPGHGTSNEIQNYDFYDVVNQPGIYDYRLKQLDFDNRSAYLSEVSVEIQPPSDFKLLQNYPNPFSHSATISFMIPAKLSGNDASLVIFDINGKEVQHFSFTSLEAGIFQVIWDGRDKKGLNLAAGVYFYRLKIGQEQRLMKLLYVK